jgi:hypothetical protein
LDGFKVGGVDFDGDTLHDQIQRKNQARLFLLAQDDSLQTCQRSAADSGYFPNLEEWIRLCVAQMQSTTQRLDL